MLAHYLVHERGLVRVVDPTLVGDPAVLPSWESPHDGTWELVFWAKHIGPLRTLGEAVALRDARDQVANRLSQLALGVGREEAIDLSRSPVIRLRRSNWNRNGCLNLEGCLRQRRGQRTGRGS